MLELKEVNKIYGEGDSSVHALKDASLIFRKSEFVSILGPSGCGKTTMLNILGGLDRYTSGDLMIDGKSTNLFTASDWDAYRNNCVGFVFQSYNLISHQTILENVEIALALSGVSAKERRARATAALMEVGLEGQLLKKPNELSGGQMQRVAIARAIVNNPEIILADEPTGALDSKTSVQIVELLKEVSKTRLVVMVTHNVDLAHEYSDRIINMLDGRIIGDSDPYEPTVEELKENTPISIEDEVPPINPEGRTEKEIARLNKKRDKLIAKKKKAKLAKTSMSLITAYKLSLRNLWSKRGRTFLTAFAGSIGIIGIALVMAVTDGFEGYIVQMQKDVLGQYPMTIMQQSINMEQAMSSGILNFDMTGDTGDLPEFPDDGVIHTPTQNQDMLSLLIENIKYNKVTSEFVEYINKLPQEYASDIVHDYAFDMKLITQHGEPDESGNMYSKVNLAGDDQSENMQAIMQLIMGSSAKQFNQLVDKEYMLSNYELINGKNKTSSYPNGWNEVVVLVNEYNQIGKNIIDNFHLADGKTEVTIDDVIGKTFRIVDYDNWYGTAPVNGVWEEKKVDKEMWDKSSGGEIKIVGVMRIKEDANSRLYNSSILYHPDLPLHIIKENRESAIGKAQLNDNRKNLGETVIEDGQKVHPDITDTVVVNFFGAETGLMINDLLGVDKKDQKEMVLQRMGLIDIPTNIYIYPTTFEAKKEIGKYIGKWNGGDIEGSGITTKPPKKPDIALDIDWNKLDPVKVQEYISNNDLIGLGTYLKETFPDLTINPLDFIELIRYNTWRKTQMEYMDPSAMVTDMMLNIVNIISIVLTCFAAISLLVSSIMIGIITYVSVVERTKEIGILRSIGARKKDIARVFNAETVTIGFTAGMMGIIASYILTIPINAIIRWLAAGFVYSNIAVLSPLVAFILVVVSVTLTFIAGLIPSGIAARKDPVLALRSE